MNVLISTVPRSGSTLLFNICRLLLEQVDGKSNTYSNWHQFFAEGHQKKNNIVKIHDRNEKYTNWSDKIITSVRDLRYIMASYSDFSKKFNINDATNLKSVCNGFVKIIENNVAVADYVFKYEDYFLDKRKIIIEIANCLQMPLEKLNIEIILNQIDDIKNKKYNKIDKDVTQMHPNHISPKTDKPITQRITIEQLVFIENNFSWFLKKHGYKLSSLIKML
jgi:hypothetical protein